METQPAPRVLISKEELKLLPLKSYEGPIHVVTTVAEEQAAAEALRAETVLGFDTESKPAFVRGVTHPTALIQLAASHAVYIFQLSQLQNLDSVITLFSDPHIVKAGIALGDDVKKMRSTYREFNPEGFVEIAELSRKAGLKQTGVRPLAGLLLGFRISKREQRSNWGAEKLTSSQLRYAATDAWAVREIYLKLKNRPATRDTAESAGP